MLQCTIIDHRSSDKLEGYAELLVERRKHKGMTLERATDLLMDGNYFGNCKEDMILLSDSP